MNKNLKPKLKFNSFVLSILLILNLLIIFVSVVGNRNNIKQFIDDHLNFTFKNNDFELDRIFEEEGFIIHIRHSRRNSSLDIHSYDFMEYKKPTEIRYIQDFTCLNNEGLAQSELLKFIFTYYSIPYEFVYSSPSCRAMQTSSLAFREPLVIINSLLYYGMFDSSLHRELDDELLYFLYQLDDKLRSNAIFVGHNLIAFEESSILDKTSSDLTPRDEGGISILQFDRESNKLIILKTYRNVSEFQKALETRALN
jgi:hypothetical protein